MLHKQIDVYSTTQKPGGEGEIKEKTGKGFYLVHSFTYVTVTSLLGCNRYLEQNITGGIYMYVKRTTNRVTYG